LIQEEHDRLQAMNAAVFLKSIACTFPPSGHPEVPDWLVY